MPPVSQAQARAMYAAAAGKSTLGIPQKVGKDFTKDVPKGLPARKASADKAKKLMKKGKK